MDKQLDRATSANLLKTTKPSGAQQVSTKPKKLTKFTECEPITSQELSSYTDLSNRKVVKKSSYISINAFKTRTTIIPNVFENENNVDGSSYPSFPKIPTTGCIHPELDQLYIRLSQLHEEIALLILSDISTIEKQKDRIKELIVNLIAIKQEIVATWNKHNPDKPYKYGKKYDNGRNILEDRLLDTTQELLYNCYSIMNDNSNELLIIDQLIEQKSGSCFSLLSAMFSKNIMDREKIDSLNFTDILTKYEKLSSSFKPDNLANNMRYTTCGLTSITAIMKLFLDNSCMDYGKLITDQDLICNFLELVGTTSNDYLYREDFEKSIRNLSLGVDLYYKHIDNPLFKGIHNTLLSDNRMVFASEFSKLSIKLVRASNIYSNIKIELQRNKAVNAHKKFYGQEINNTMQQIKELFIKHKIPTTDMGSWFSTFINNGFIEIFGKLSINSTIQIAKWIDLSIKNSETPAKNIEIKDNIMKWLDILEKDYKNLVNDRISWAGFPKIILQFFAKYMTGNSLQFTFSALGIPKDGDLAILNAKLTQGYYPFLGTVFLAIAHKDSYDDLLSDLDMLEFISQQTGKTKYINSSKYLMAQIITYLLDKNNKLTLDKKQYLFNKAEKLYLEMADLGINRAYLLLAETTASLAKEKMYSEGFLKAAKLYDKASSYCNVLSVVDGIESELQDLAIINMNCFSAEADVLRKLSGEQQPLLQKPTTPVVTATGKNNSSKQKAETVETNEPQELAEEVTAEEVQAWQFANEVTSSKPISGKATKVKTQEVVNKSFTRKDIVSQRNFWKIAKELHMSGTNLEKSYSLIEKLIQCDYFNILVAELKNGTAGKDSWMVPFLYQNMAYYHFLQQKYAKEIGSKMKLFYVSTSSIKGASKAEEADFAKVSAEAEYLIRQIISLICPDIPDVKTKNLRELMLSLSSDNYETSPHKRRLAATVSTYGHLISLDDFAQGRRGDDRLAAKLYDKADEINPNRVIKKLEKKVA
jgi:hypothetical protein